MLYSVPYLSGSFYPNKLIFFWVLLSFPVLVTFIILPTGRKILTIMYKFLKTSVYKINNKDHAFTLDLYKAST